MADTERAHTQSPPPGCPPHDRLTRSLLGYGVVAGPLYVVLWVGQAMTRDGFDPARHAASLLANGSWGWVQVLNFVLAGAMTVAAGVGIARATGSRWAGGLIVGYGAGLVGAAVFPADPVDGFPLGTPSGPAEPTVQGLLHLATGGLGFLCLIAACLVLGSRFARRDEKGWAAFSRVTGVLFLAAFVGIASGIASPTVVLAFSAAVVLAWAWLAAVALHLYRGTAGGRG